MEENKIVYRSIEEQLAEEEGKKSSASVPTTRPVEKTNRAPRKGKKKLRMKKSVRRTVGSLLLATSIVVGAIPVGSVQADSTTGGYGGSDLTYDQCVTNGYINATGVEVDLPIPSTGTHYGGYPLVEPEKDEYGNYKPTLSLGVGHDYFAVNPEGYKNNDSIRPIYGLDSSGSDIEKYFETVESASSKDTYTPHGKLNLIVGYTLDSTANTDWTKVDKSKWWVNDNKLYIPELKKFEFTIKEPATGNDYTYVLIGKRIGEYNPKSVLTHHVRCIIDDGTAYWEGDVEDNHLAKDYPGFPVNYAPSTKGNTFSSWDKSIDMPITKDTDFVALYTTSNGRARNTNSLDESNSELEEGGVENEKDISGNDGSELESGNPDNTDEPEIIIQPETTNQSGEDNSGVEGSNPSNQEVDNLTNQENGENSENDNSGLTSQITIEYHYNDYCGGGYGLNGILLQMYPDTTPPDPNAIEYNDNASTYYYVCDTVAGISNICNNAFESTSGVHEVDLPSNLINIGNEAFKDSGVTAITIGDGINGIGASAFEGCKDLSTVDFSINANFRSIGSKAFDASNLQNFIVKDSGDSGVCIPACLKEIGDAAFHSTQISNVDFSKAVECNVGNCAFAECDSLAEVNLDYYNQGTNTIKNLDKDYGGAGKGVKGLFVQCANLTKANMPSKFNGRISLGTFGSCEIFKHIKFNNKTSSFSDGEFDKTKIIVEGPDVIGRPDLSIEPESTTADILSYKDCLKCDASDNSNNYTYRFVFEREEDGKAKSWYDYCNVKSKDNANPTKEKNDFVFEIDNKGLITGVTNRSAIHPSCDLEIGDTVGENEIFIYGIDKEVFMGAKGSSIVKLTLPKTIILVDESAFQDCSKLESLRIITNGTSLKGKAFYNDREIKTITYVYAGEDGYCSIGSECFTDCIALETVRFLSEEDGDYLNGSVDISSGKPEKYKIDRYAKFSDDGIDPSAFTVDKTNRDVPIVFVGPMEKGYAPYMYAIGKGKYSTPGKISKQQVYIRYESGNPQNLACSYFAEAPNAELPHKLPVPDATATDDVKEAYSKNSNSVYVAIDASDKSLKDKYGEELLKSVPHLENGNYVTPAGVYLLDYPNMTTYVDDAKSKSVKKIDELKIPDRTDMVSAIAAQTKNITIPYGIDFIDKAYSDINDGSYHYYAFDKGDSTSNGSIFSKGTHMFPPKYGETEPSLSRYHMFAYVKDLESVTFEEESAWYIPAYAFEGPYVLDPDDIVNDPDSLPKSVKSIVFNQDVKLLGELPFYCPDPEDYYSSSKVTDYEKTFAHSYRSPSCLESVVFANTNDSGEGEKGNPAYSCENGIVKSKIKNNSKTDVTVEEILPGRGFLDGIPSKTIGSSINGVNELSGVTKFAPYAARDCDSIQTVDLSATNATIPEGCFYDCDKISSVTMCDNGSTGIDVKSKAFGAISSRFNIYCPEKTGQYNFEDDTFEPGNPKLNTQNPEVIMNCHKEAGRLIKYSSLDEDHLDTPNPLHPNVTLASDFLKDEFPIRFKYNGKTDIFTAQTDDPAVLHVPSETPIHPTDPDKWEFDDWEGTYDDEEEPVPFDIYYPLVKRATFEPTWKEKTAGTFDITLIPEFDGVEVPEKADSKTWVKGEDFFENFSKTVAGWSLSTTKNYNGKKYTLNDLRNAPYNVKNLESYDKSIIMVYESNDPTPTPTPTPTGTPSSSSSSGGSSSKSSSSSSSKSSSSGSSSSAYPVFVNSQDTAAGSPTVIAGEGSTVYIDEGSGSGSGGSGKKVSGNASVISTTGGISDTGKISATVNGSSDNYVIKITQTQEADEQGLAALHNKYGDDITPIRYLAFDISLYDSTGTNKISPVPAGVSVTITMPIPDDLAIYGGNAKIACTTGGVLDVMTPRFTVINGVPCMTFTCTHFSPYMVWVDTANLTEAGISDATPKTADGIHPKWFLCFGLAAIAVVMFLKKDPEEYLKKKAA